MKTYITPRDFNHHYKDCIGIITDPDTEQIRFFKCLGISPSRDSAREYAILGSYCAYNFRDVERSIAWRGTEFLNTSESYKNLTFPWPVLGLIHCNQGSAFLERLPNAGNGQYKRGFSLANLQLVHNNLCEYYLLGRSPVQVESLGNPRMLKQIFNPTYYKFNTAIRILESGNRIAVNLSPNFYISLSVFSENLVLGYRTQIVGAVIENKIKLFAYADFLEASIKTELGEDVL